MPPLRCLAWVPTTCLRVTPKSPCSLPAPLPSPSPRPSIPYWASHPVARGINNKTKSINENEV